MHFIFSGASLSDTQPIASFQANHAPKSLSGNQVGCGNAKASAEDAVERRRETAALHVAKHGDSNFLVEHFAKPPTGHMRPSQAVENTDDSHAMFVNRSTNNGALDRIAARAHHLPR